MGMGPIEMLTVGSVVLVFVGGVIGLVVLLATVLRKSRGTAEQVCPACRGKFAGSAKFCPHCGKTL